MSQNRDTLRLELPDLPCRIGILEGENETPQPVRVAVTVELDLTAVLESGDIVDSVDYAPLHGTLVRQVREETWTLIEGLAGAIMVEVLAVEGVLAATVEVTKLTPPLGPDAGPVTLRLRRERR
jgi:dihydroneopterin aldolase